MSAFHNFDVPLFAALDGRPRLDEASFQRLRDLIYKASGMYFDQRAVQTLERRLRPRLEALSLDSFEHYYLYLQFDRDRRRELELALDHVAIHETYFFREARALDAFAKEILPEIHERNADEKVLRVWSAGCSTGEEAYTLAILIHETKLFADWRVELTASDLSARVISEARTGRYSEKAFRTTDDERRRSYFTENQDRTWTIEEPFRQMVNFGCFNLADSRRFDIFADLDVIFCRNVMIYFDTAARRQTVAGFHRQLRPGGYLILGASESLITINSPFRLAHLQHDLVYRKEGDGGRGTGVG